MISLLTLSLSAAFAQSPAVSDSVETTLHISRVQTDAIVPTLAPAAPDRSQPPTVSPADPWQLPSWQVHAINNNVHVYHVRVPGVRKVVLTAVRHSGALDIDDNRTYSAWATGWLQDAASDSHSPAELEMAYDSLNAAPWSDGPQLARSLSGFSAPAEDFDEALTLYASTLLHPTYPKAELKRFSRETLLNLTKLAPSSPKQIAGYALGYAWATPDSPYGYRSELSELKQLKAPSLIVKNKRLNAGPVSFLVVGDRSWESLEGPLTAAFSAMGTKNERSAPPAFVPPSESQHIAVNVPGSKQAVVRLRMAAPPKEHADSAAFELLNWAYGGAFLSRLNRNIREERGWTYGSRSSYARDAVRGSFTVSFDTKAALTADAIEQTQLELNRLVNDGLRPEEIQSAWAESVATWNQRLSDASSAESLYRSLLLNEETIAPARARLLKQGTLTPKDAAPVGQRWLGQDAAQLWLVVGDRALLEDELKETGDDWRWISAEDAVLGAF